MDELWYKNVTYEDAKDMVKESLASTVEAFIASGYWLKYIRDSREYNKDGYDTLWTFAEKELGLQISEASRAMSMNDKYSVDGNSPVMLEKYKQYNKSQLQEMLTMTDEQIEQVTPGMRIKDIRGIKNAEACEPEEDDTGPDDSCDVARESDSVNTECGEESEVSEDIIVDIEVTPEQEDPLNVEFDTEELMRELDDDVIDGEYREVEEEQGLDEGSCDTPTAAGLKWSPYPEFCSCCGYNGAQCCAQCKKGQSHNCNGRCGWVDEPYKPDGETIAPDEKTDEQTEEQTDELSRLKDLLDKKNNELDEYLAVEGIPEPVLFEKKAVVAALANMICELEEMDMIAKEQPALPNFKNNDERKAWLEDVEAWGLWYEDQNIQARYYKYDFSDGSRLIAVRYRYTCPEWMKGQKMFEDSEKLDGTYRNTHYHMIYSDEYRAKHTSEYDKYYTNATVSISILIDFIKEIAKREKNPEDQNGNY
ncbi:MAG: hypothetical protein NC434_10950 [Ruminococcus sp.]|nr:hypothetical protein [Ruminococcus sp.]